MAPPSPLTSCCAADASASAEKSARFWSCTCWPLSVAVWSEDEDLLGIVDCSCEREVGWSGPCGEGCEAGQGAVRMILRAGVPGEGICRAALVSFRKSMQQGR